MESLYFDAWKSLSTGEKESVIKDVTRKQNIPLKFKEMKKHENIDLAFFQAGDEKLFAFVPGRRQITLGWDSKSSVLSKDTISYMKKEFEEEFQYELEQWEENKKDYIVGGGGLILDGIRYKPGTLMPGSVEEKPSKHTIEEWIDYVDDMTSPLRVLDISPMIVEICPITAKKDYKSELAPFRLPTEDEWEYLRGCGEKSFFSWEGFLETVFNSVYRISSGDLEQSDMDFIEKPNIFGLLFDLSTYVYELVDAECFVKGADGGCSMCGGDGPFYTLPILSPFYRPKSDKKEIFENYYSYRRIIQIKI